MSTELFRAYKPQAETYLGAARMLGCAPDETMMVAAHNSDLAAAASLGLQTAFIARPSEYGPRQTKDLRPEGDWTIVAESMTQLAEALGC
jgi:2-haloacid dehalogenase